eukprot:gene1266-32614_t
MNFDRPEGRPGTGRLERLLRVTGGGETELRLQEQERRKMTGSPHCMSSSPLPPSLGALGALGDGERAVLECLAAELNTSPEAVDLNKSLLQCGMGSLQLKTAPDSHMLLLTMHHAVCDGWSMTLMMSEAVTSYNAFLSGSEPWLDPLSIQYSDYAMWHDTHLRESGKMEREIEYWRKNLAGIPPILELPIDKRRPSQPSGRGGRVPFSVPSDIVVELRRLGMECNATLFMVMLAGFKVVLARQAGMDDIVVGTPSAGRAQSELQELIGFFVNTLVLRTDLSGNPDFRTLIGRVKDTSLGAYANQSVQFHKIVEKLSGIERSLHTTPSSRYL